MPRRRRARKRNVKSKATKYSRFIRVRLQKMYFCRKIVILMRNHVFCAKNFLCKKQLFVQKNIFSAFCVFFRKKRFFAQKTKELRYFDGNKVWRG